MVTSWVKLDNHENFGLIINKKQSTDGLENIFESSYYVVWKTVLFL